MTSLKKKASKGILWIAIEKFGQNGIKLIFGIILARLLTPQDFGLIGIVTVFFTLAMVFVESGFSSAYIQKKDADELDANTIFYFNLIVSVILYVIIWFLAPLIADFYKRIELINLIRIMSVVLIINSFQLIQFANISKELNFKQKTKANLSGVLLGGILGIVAAYKGFGYWSLVIQSLSRLFISTILLWILNSWRPQLIFSFSRLKQLFSFSSWLLLGMIVKTAFDNIYTLTIGKFFPMSELGFYTKAKQFQRIPTDTLTKAIEGITFPILSNYQDDQLKMVSLIRKFLQNAMFVIVFASFLLLIIAKPFVLVFLTEKWEPMIIYLQLLCVAGVLYPIHSINVRTLLALGYSKLNFKVSLIRNSLRVINIIIMYRFGVIYIIFGEVIASFLILVLNGFYTNKFLNYGISKQIIDIYKNVVSGIVMLLVGYLLTIFFENNIILLVISIISSSFVYFVIQYVINRSQINEIQSIVHHILKK